MVSMVSMARMFCRAQGSSLEPGDDLIFAGGFDDQQGAGVVTARAEGTAEDDETVVLQRVHEGRVLGPRVLLTHRPLVIPAFVVDCAHGECRHVKRLSHS